MHLIYSFIAKCVIECEPVQRKSIAIKYCNTTRNRPTCNIACNCAAYRSTEHSCHWLVGIGGNVAASICSGLEYGGRHVDFCLWFRAYFQHCNMTFCVIACSDILCLGHIACTLSVDAVYFYIYPMVSLSVRVLHTTTWPVHKLLNRSRCRLLANSYVPNEPLSLIHIWRCRRSYACRSRWSPYH